MKCLLLFGSFPPAIANSGKERRKLSELVQELENEVRYSNPPQEYGKHFFGDLGRNGLEFPEMEPIQMLLLPTLTEDQINQINKECLSCVQEGLFAWPHQQFWAYAKAIAAKDLGEAINLVKEYLCKKLNVPNGIDPVKKRKIIQSFLNHYTPVIPLFFAILFTVSHFFTQTQANDLRVADPNLDLILKSSDLRFENDTAYFDVSIIDPGILVANAHRGTEYNITAFFPGVI